MFQKWKRNKYTLKKQKVTEFCKLACENTKRHSSGKKEIPGYLDLYEFCHIGGGKNWG